MLLLLIPEAEVAKGVLSGKVRVTAAERPISRSCCRTAPRVPIRAGPGGRRADDVEG
jgi:hypothetical protein